MAETMAADWVERSASLSAIRTVADSGRTKVREQVVAMGLSMASLPAPQLEKIAADSKGNVVVAARVVGLVA
jgi:hypothetical protein